MQLERNGFGVYYIGEIGGHHFDLLMVSVTYGLININGELTKDRAELNRLDMLPFLPYDWK